MAKGLVVNLDALTLENPNFRKVIYTARHSQLVLMTIKPGDEIGMEIHPENDQFLKVESGGGKAIIDENEYEFSKGYSIIIPAASNHNIIITSETDERKLYTVSSLSHHRLDLTHPERTHSLCDS